MFFRELRSAILRHSGQVSFLTIPLLILAASISLAAESSGCIGQVKANSPGTSVSLSGKVVTGVFPGFFYIQDPEPGHTSCGIMVKSPVAPTVRDTISIEGILATDPVTGELCIQSPSFDIIGVAPLPKALGRTNRSVGTTGINTIGVLQTTWGKAGSVVVGQSMMIDDGSGAPLKVIGPVYGISGSDYVRVTGIAGLEQNGSLRVLRIRNSSDAVVMGVTPSVLTEPLIDLNPAALPLGELAFWTNTGTLGGLFGADFTAPTVGMVDGRKCVTFDGSDRMRATFTAPSGITGSGSYSVVFWAYKTTLWPEMPVLSWAARNGEPGTVAQFNFGNYLTNGAATHGSALFDLPFGAHKPSANHWHQIAVTYDGAVEKAYINGVLSAEKAGTLAIAPDQRVYLGCGFNFDGSVYAPQAHLQASVAGLQVYDYALSHARINELYTSVVTTRTISGTVRSKAQGNALSNARVYVATTIPASANPDFYTTTDAMGNYSVRVPSGVWNVMATAVGYHDAVEPAVDLTGSDVANLDFALALSTDQEVVRIEAVSLPPGSLQSCTNLGTQRGIFTSVGAAPVVEMVAGLPCITFNGDGYLRSDFAMPLHTTGNLDYSICAWVYNPLFAPEETVFSWAKSGGAAGTCAKFNFGGSTTVGALNYGGGIGYAYSSGSTSPGKWHHVAVTYGGVGRHRLYVDGVIRSISTVNLDIDYGCPAFVGCGYSFDGSTYYPETPFSGSIAQLSVYDRQLDATTISALAATNPKLTKVMPLGDSITDGYQIPGGYRTKLWSNIETAGKHIDFVGSASNGPVSLPDKNHEGHPGWTSVELINGIDAWMDTHRPKIVLLHICTNDIYFGANATTCISRLSTLVDKICAKLPLNGKVYVAKIIPWGTAYPGLDNVVQDFNSRIPGMAAEKAAQGKPVYVVNMYGDETNPDGLFQADLADGVHPTQTGYNKMADIWWNALKHDLFW